MLYQIQTEDINRPDIIKIVLVFFDGFTIIPTIGYYRGMKENSIIIEIISNGGNLPKIQAIATAIQIMNKQESVLIGYIEEHSELIR